MENEIERPVHFNKGVNTTSPRGHCRKNSPRNFQDWRELAHQLAKIPILKMSTIHWLYSRHREPSRSVVCAQNFCKYLFSKALVTSRWFRFQSWSYGLILDVSIKNGYESDVNITLSEFVLVKNTCWVQIPRWDDLLCFKRNRLSSSVYFYSNVDSSSFDSNSTTQIDKSISKPVQTVDFRLHWHILQAFCVLNY